MEFLAQPSDLLRFDVTDDVDKYRLPIALGCQYDDPLDRIFVARFQIDADALLLFLSSDDALPPLRVQLFSNFLRAFLEVRAIFIVQANGGHAHHLERLEQM